MLRKDYPSLPEVQVRGMLAVAQWDETMIAEGVALYTAPSGNVLFHPMHGLPMIIGLIALFSLIGGSVTAWIFLAYGIGDEERAPISVISPPLPLGYARQSGIVFWNGVPMTTADASSFSILDGHYAKDKTAVFFDGISIIGADASTFLLTTATSTDGRDAEDASGVYRAGARLGDALATTTPVVLPPVKVFNPFISLSSDGSFHLSWNSLLAIIDGHFRVAGTDEYRSGPEGYYLSVTLASTSEKVTTPIGSLDIVITDDVVPAKFRDKVLTPLKKTPLTRMTLGSSGIYLSDQKGQYLWFPAGEADYVYVSVPRGQGLHLIDNLLSLYPPDEDKYAASVTGLTITSPTAGKVATSTKGRQ